MKPINLQLHQDENMEQYLQKFAAHKLQSSTNNTSKSTESQSSLEDQSNLNNSSNSGSDSKNSKSKEEIYEEEFLKEIYKISEDQNRIIVN